MMDLLLCSEFPCRAVNSHGQLLWELMGEGCHRAGGGEGPSGHVQGLTWAVGGSRGGPRVEPPTHAMGRLCTPTCAGKPGAQLRVSKAMAFGI